MTEPPPSRPATAPTRAWITVAGLLAGAGWGSNQFTPMLLVYRTHLGLSTATLEALFGAYAAGLIPGLLVAARWSDVHGRRTPGLVAAALSLLASVSLIAGAHTVALLFLGRLLAGAGSGAAFGVGTAWLREVSIRPFGHADAHTVARRAAVAMTIGFAFGPLVAGALAQWLPAAMVIPYLPHLALMIVVLASLRRVPETADGGGAPHRDGGGAPHPDGGGAAHTGMVVRLPAADARRFRRVVVPMAPWVFAAPAIAFALLPSVVGTAHATDGIAITAAITWLTALAGVLIQPVARRLDVSGAPEVPATPGASRGGVIGLTVVAAGLALAAVAADVQHIWLLVPCAIVLGSAYGLCLVAGLLEVQRLAPAHALAGLTAVFYAFTYLGFAAPYLLALAANVASYATLLAITGGLAVACAALVRRGGQRQTADARAPISARG